MAFCQRLLLGEFEPYDKAVVGLIKTESSKKAGRQLSVYRITPEGTKFMKEHSQKMTFARHNFAALRPIIIELTEAEQVPKMFPNLVSSTLEFHREMIDSKKNKIPRDVLRSLLKEYALSLEAR